MNSLPPVCRVGLEPQSKGGNLFPLRAPDSRKSGRELFKAAIIELDPAQLQLRVKPAEEAINTRASSDARVSRDEREAMDDALSTSRPLKKRQS